MNFHYLISKGRLFFLVAVCAVVFVAQAGAIVKPDTPEPSIKIFEIDGDVFHDQGALLNHVTNWGLIGSAPSIPTSFSHAPSGRWPGQTGTDFIWAGGLWVGAIMEGVPTVSTGGWNSVLMPTEALADSIHSTYQGAVGGSRFPWPLADDDGDGFENEDPLNSLDDDNDGQVDEDFAAISQQQYRCTMRDDTELSQEVYPDHVPLGISIVQESFQWDAPFITNAIGYEFTITNVGTAVLEDVYLGMFTDFDIEQAEDDMAGYWSGQVEASNGMLYRVQLTYMMDAASTNPVQGVEGWVLLGHTTDPSGNTAPSEVETLSYNSMSGNQSFEHGGDPTNDAERYQLLSTAQFDSPTIHPNDHRVITSSGPFASLNPGESLQYQLALVAGINLDQLKINAAEMVACFEGREFDREGELERVHWIPLDEEVVAAGRATLFSQSIAGGLEISFETNLSSDDNLALIRRASSTLNRRVWSGADLVFQGYSSEGSRYSISDHDPGSGSRGYDLVQEYGGAEVILDHLELDFPLLPGISMTTSPNPFNPSLEIKYVLVRAGHVRLEVFDMRGHLVRTLLDDVRAAGEGVLTWDGRNGQGQTLASGVYRLKMAADGELTQRSVSLVK